MSPALRVRSTTFYRAVLALPLVVLIALFASGTAQAYWTLAFSSITDPHRAPSLAGFEAAFASAVLWIAAIAPLLFAAWELGKQHTPARTLNSELFSGSRDVVRLATGRPLSPEQIDAFTRPLKDRPGCALAWGTAVAIFVPTFFLLAPLPPLHSARGIMWLVGAGMLMGFGVYCQRRAAPYLVEEPGRWDIFRQQRLLNPRRYEPAGRRFVRWEIVVSIVVPVWWLGGGAIVMSQ